MHAPEVVRDEFPESIATATGLAYATAASCGFWLIVGIAVAPLVQR